MKILRSIHSLNPAIGGPIESVRQSSAVLAARGHEVEVMTLDAEGDPWLNEFPVRTHALGDGRGGYGYSPRLTPWLRAHHREYDAVIVQGVWQYSSFGVWRALHGTSTPYYVFPHGMLDPWFRRTYPLKHIKKLLYWPWAERRVLRDAAAVLFTSEEERRLARESFPFYRCNEVVVSYGTARPNVDLAAARAEFFARFPELQGKRLFLFLSRVHEKKGCDLLLDAFARVAAPDTHLVVAGPAADENYLRILREHAGANVSFTGMLSGNVKWGALAAAEVFVLASHQENFGLAVVEALACGTPVLISKEINIWREITEAGGGFADEDTVGGTMRLLERWLALSPNEQSAMRAAARKCFDARFEIERAVDNLLEVIQRT
jgi:glycosyltransferase involved in cell wall biosynthesis